MNSLVLLKYLLRTRKLQILLIWATIVISSASFYVMNGFIDSLKLRLFNSARTMSSGDIKISSFQEFKPAWNSAIEKILGNNYLASDMMVFPNMVRKENGDTFLVSVKAVDEKYPFYGEIKLRNQKNNLLKASETFIAKEVIDRFHIKIGDFLFLGSEKLLVAGAIEELPDQGFSGSSAFNPPMLVKLESAKSSGLIQFGSRVSYIKAYKSRSTTSQEKIEKDAEAIEENLASEPIQITTWKESQNMSKSLFDRLGSFFNILSYTALILSSIGFYLGLSVFVIKFNKEGSVLHGLGVAKKTIFQSLMFLFAILVSTGCLVGLIFGLIGENYLVHQIDDLVVTYKTFSPHYSLMAFTFIFCFISSGVVICIFVNKFIKTLNPLHYNNSFSQNYFSIRDFLTYIIVVLSLLILFSWYQTEVLKTSMGLVGMILLLLLLLFSFITLLVFCLQVLTKPLGNNPLIFMARIEFFKNKAQHLPSLIGLVLSSVLVLGIISTRESLNQKLTINNQKDLANIFMIDIQKSQLPDVDKLVNSNLTYKNFNYSPLIRARLTHINQFSVEELKSKAKEKNEFRKISLLNRISNLTYKDELNNSEKIVEGEFWENGYDGSGISLEEDFAKSLNINLGDTICFDLAGLPLEGQVTSIRKIDWSSLLPNFFVIFPKKRLENAPQFIIGSAHIDENSLASFQNQLVNLFPNISVIELGAIFKKVQKLFEKVLKVLFVSTALIILASFVIMLSALFAGEEEITKRNFYMRSIGMNAKQIVWVSIYEKLIFVVVLVSSVLILQLIWNQLIGIWLNEAIAFRIDLFLFYAVIVFILIFMPLILNRMLSRFQTTMDN